MESRADVLVALVAIFGERYAVRMSEGKLVAAGRAKSSGRRPRLRRVGLAILALLATAALALTLWEPLTATRYAAVPYTPTDVRIARDAWGVPHVFGATDADVAYGVGYAHAEDDFATLEEVLAMTRGRLAAITGEEGAKADVAGYLIDGRGATLRHYDALPADVKAIFTAYAAGLNRYAERHPQEQRLRGLFPVTPQDVVAGFAIRSPFFFGLDSVLGALVEGKPLPREGGPPIPGLTPVRAPTRTTPPPTGAPAAPIDASAPRSTTAAFGPLFGSGEGMNGSNAWAIAPSRTSDGSTWLVSNAHQPWTGGVAWYELVVHSRQGWDFAGATFPGSPYPFLGHNRDLGWTNTVNRPDLIDVYRLTLDESGDKYRFDGVWRPIEQRRVWLRVKFGPFTLPIPRTIERSVHGPIIRNASGAYAVRYAGIGRIDMVTQYYRIQKARNFDEWRAAMGAQGVPGTNFIYADRTGRVGMFYNAMFPDRPAGYDWRGILPGDTSRTLWTRTLPFDRVPALVSPRSGAVFNANNTPFNAAGTGSDMNPASVDPRLGVELDETNRSLRARALLDVTPRIDWPQLRAMKYDTAYAREGYALAFMNEIAALDLSREAELAAAQRLLAGWDWNLDGRGPADALALMVLRPSNRAHYQRTGERVDARAVLAETVAHLKTHFGRIDPPLGEVLRLRHGEGPSYVDLPLDGGNDTLRASTLWDADPDGRLRVRHGDSFLMFVRWDRAGRVASRSIQPFGAATRRPDSPHHSDQARAFVRHETKRVLFEPADLFATNPRIYRP